MLSFIKSKIGIVVIAAVIMSGICVSVSYKYLYQENRNDKSLVNNLNQLPVVSDRQQSKQSKNLKKETENKDENKSQSLSQTPSSSQSQSSLKSNQVPSKPVVPKSVHIPDLSFWFKLDSQGRVIHRSYGCPNATLTYSDGSIKPVPLAEGILSSEDESIIKIVYSCPKMTFVPGFTFINFTYKRLSTRAKITVTQR